MDGLQRLLNFLALLRARKIMFNIEQQSNDALMVSFALVGVRVEVEFFVDHLEFSYFTGDEEVYRDEAQLKRLIEQYSA